MAKVKHFGELCRSCINEYDSTLNSEDILFPLQYSVSWHNLSNAIRMTVYQYVDKYEDEVYCSVEYSLIVWVLMRKKT